MSVRARQLVEMLLESDEVHLINLDVDPRVKLIAYETDKDIKLCTIKIPKQEQGKGLGTATMQKLVAYADSVHKRVLLTPTTEFGASSVGRLTRFYKQFGFVENKGRKQDFSTRDRMIREPKA